MTAIRVWYNNGEEDQYALVKHQDGDKADLLVFDNDGNVHPKNDVPRRDRSDYQTENDGHTWHP